jgi:hypothetical protein
MNGASSFRQELFITPHPPAFLHFRFSVRVSPVGCGCRLPLVTLVFYFVCFWLGIAPLSLVPSRAGKGVGSPLPSLKLIVVSMCYLDQVCATCLEGRESEDWSADLSIRGSSYSARGRDPF